MMGIMSVCYYEQTLDELVTLNDTSGNQSLVETVLDKFNDNPIIIEIFNSR